MGKQFRWQVSVTMEGDPNGDRPILAGFENQADAEHWAEMIDENPEYAEIHVDETPGQALTPEVKELIRVAREAIAYNFFEPNSVDPAPFARDALENALQPFTPLNERFPLSDWKYEVANEDTKLGFLEWQQHRAESEKQSAPETRVS